MDEKYRLQHENFGLRILQERKRHRWSQEKLAEKANINKNTVSIIELGESSPKLDTILALAEALGINPSELLDF